jgi:hypothetical protein
MTETLIDSTYEPCAQCDAPLDGAQRYCVFCGASRHHGGDPVARYLAAARRPAPAAPPPAVATGSPRSERWLVVSLVLLPLAAAAGVLVGRDSAGNDALVAALRAQKAPVVQVGGAGAATTASTASAGGSGAAASTTTTTFPLAKGYTVQLRTLPSGADATAIGAAKKAAEGKGAKDVGVLDPAGVDVRPDPGRKLVVYAGAYRTRAQAEKALAKVKHDFPGAKVVSVRRPAAAADAADAPVAKHPTAKQKADGAKIVQQIQAAKGRKYVQQQRKLPDTIVVP